MGFKYERFREIDLRKVGVCMFIKVFILRFGMCYIWGDIFGFRSRGRFGERGCIGRDNMVL